MINERLMGQYSATYRALVDDVAKEYKSLPWADSFVNSFAAWLLEVDVFSWKEGVIPETACGSLELLLREALPPPMALALRKKIQDGGDCTVSLVGFLMGRALALAALDHESYGMPAVTDLQHRWWSYPGFTCVIIQDVQKHREKSRAYRMAQQYIQSFEMHPEKGIVGKRDRQQFSSLCRRWREEGTLAELWNNSFGWSHFSTTRFDENIVSDLLRAAPDLILPLLNTISIPTLMDNILRDVEIQYDPDLLQALMHDAPLGSDLDENSMPEPHADPKIPAWNRSIVAAVLLSFIVDYAQALLGDREAEESKDTQEATDFLKSSAEILIARPDGLFLAKHFVWKLHHNIGCRQQGCRCSDLFLEAIVDEVESQEKNILLMRWLALEHEEGLKNFPETEVERFWQTGLQSEQRDKGRLEALVAHAQLLPLADLQGTSETMRRDYESLFCFQNKGFYTSEYSRVLPGPEHEALAWIFSTDGDNPTGKWEQTWEKLGAAANRLFRDFFYGDMLELMYVLNFHLAVGLAVADNVLKTHGVDSAKKVCHCLFVHLLGRLRLNDTLDVFYRKMIRIVVCKLYLYLCLSDKENHVSLSELVVCLRSMQSIPMLGFESIESLMLNGLKVQDIQLSTELKEVTTEAYRAAQVHDANDHWTIRDKKIARTCEDMLAQLNT